MANSLVKLTLESNQYEQGLRKAKKGFEDFTRSLGVNMKTLSTYAIAAGAVTTAMKVMKDAFFNNEEQLDAWGRTVKSSESLYKGFLNTLNTGDISGYLNNISEITKAAREAYDALDELATFKAFNRVNIARARSGYSEAVADYREGKGSKDSVQQASANLIKELQQTQKLQNNAYEKAIADLARQRQVSPEDLRKVMTGNYGSFKELKELKYTGKELESYGGGMFGGGGTYEELIPANERERLAQAIKHINDTELDALQALGEAAQMTSVEINNQRRAVARILNGRGGGGGGTKTSSRASVSPFTAKDFSGIGMGITTSMDTLLAQQQFWKKALSGATNMFEAGDAQAMLDKLQKQIDAQPLALRIGISTEDAVKLKDQTDSIIGIVQEGLKNEAKNITPLSNLNEIGDELYKNFTDAASAIGAIGSAMRSIEDPAAKVFGTIAQAIATVALSFAKSLEKTVSPWDWIPAAIAGTATMISTIASIKSATSGNFANGGIVPGNHYSGDMLRTSDYGINSGELILNKAQQNNIASELTKSENNVGGKAEATISAETIKIVLKTGASRRGVSVGEWLEL